MKKVAALLLVFCFVGLVQPVLAGWHFGEFRDLSVSVEYFDYAYLTPSGEPVYYIGSTMRYRITLKNEGNRTYNNFQSRSTLKWAESTTCQRWWHDNQTVSYQRDVPMPGNSESGLRPANMRKGGQTTYDVVYLIPMEVCPGQGYIQVDGRHKNQSGRDEVASFKIPIGVEWKRK